MIEIKVTLSANDIAIGDPKIPASCPVARALNNTTALIQGYWEVTSRNLIWHNELGLTKAKTCAK